MSVAKKALAIAREMRRKEREKKRLDLQERKRYRSMVAGLEKKASKALAGFNGVRGIKRKGNQLFQGGFLRAQMDVQHETWDNPNYDYKMEESGHVIRWTVWYNNGVKKQTGATSSGSLDSFAEAMAEFMQ